MKKAFTLIELLVVIAIIAILAAILFPVFAKAKEAAKKTADLNNSKQIGIGLNLYLPDFDDTFMPSNHRQGNGQMPEASWNWIVLPYMKNEQIFASPSDKIGGWAPTCWNPADNNRGFGVPSIQENGCEQGGYPNGVYALQVGRISYVANQSIIGRKRQPSDRANVVVATTIDKVSGTILIAPATEGQNCMRTEIGGEYRTYRPAFGIGTRNQGILSGNNPPTDAALPLEALTKNTRNNVWRCERDNDPGISLQHTLRYTHSGRFENGNNYVFADTSAKFRSTDATFDVNNFAWGTKAYSVGALDVVDPATGKLVQ
jgi:prepilin-type N-terminal cleavage/methylation domain-containing protein